VFGFEQGVAADRIDLSYDVPAKLAESMRDGELDVALLPAIELARIRCLEIVPGLAIGSLGACRSVLLVAKKPVEGIRRVALDPDSRTSNALVRILFGTYWRSSPEFLETCGHMVSALDEADAVVRIGDKALFEPVPRGTVAHDLGEIWTRLTGLPFVFAVWAARPGAVDRSLYRAFHASRRHGSQFLDAIADDYTWQGRRFPDISRDYLRRAIRYRLGADEVRGLRRFHDLARQSGLTDGSWTWRDATFVTGACRAALQP
jgi:chorismate dehydratase